MAARKSHNPDGTWAKGNRAGPGRPPRGLGLSDRIREILAETADGKPDLKKLDVVLRQLITRAMDGDLNAISMLFNRGFGKEPDIIKLDKDGTLDLSKLSDAELVTWQTLLQRVGVDDGAAIANRSRDLS